MIGQFQRLSSREDFKKSFSSLSPNGFDNATRASYFAAREYSRTLQQRMNTLRSSFSMPGVQPNAESEKQGPLLAYNGADIGGLLGARQQAQRQTRWAVWLNSFTQWGDQDSDSGYSGFDYHVCGGTLGVDRVVNDHLILGVGAGCSYTDIDPDDNGGDGDIKSLFGSIYGSYFGKRAYLETVLSYTRQDYGNERKVVIGTMQRHASSDHDGNLYSACLAGGYYFPDVAWRWGPFGSMRYSYLDEESFKESGAGSLDMEVKSRKTRSLISNLGFRAGRVFKTRNGSLIPEVSLARLYDFDIDDRTVTSSVAGAPGTWFSVKGQPVDNNWMVVGASVTLLSDSGYQVSMNYGGEFRDSYTGHAVFGEFRFEF